MTIVLTTGIYEGEAECRYDSEQAAVRDERQID